MTSYTRYFSVNVTEIAKRTLLEVLVDVQAKRLVNLDGAYIYEVEGEQGCLWIEQCIRRIVGVDNYRLHDTLPQGFYACNIFDVTL